MRGPPRPVGTARCIGCFTARGSPPSSTVTGARTSCSSKTQMAPSGRCAGRPRLLFTLVVVGRARLQRGARRPRRVRPARPSAQLRLGPAARGGRVGRAHRASPRARRRRRRRPRARQRGVQPARAVAARRLGRRVGRRAGPGHGMVALPRQLQPARRCAPSVRGRGPPHATRRTRRETSGIHAGRYVEVLAASGGVVPEFVNPKYSDASRSGFKKPTRLECMMQDLPWLLHRHAPPHAAPVSFTAMDGAFTYAPAKNSLHEARKNAAAGRSPASAPSAGSTFSRERRTARQPESRRARPLPSSPSTRPTAPSAAVAGRLLG